MNRKYFENLLGIAKRKARLEAESAEKNFSRKMREGYKPNSDYASDVEHLNKTHAQFERASDETHKARVRTGIAATALAGAGGYGVYRAKQNQVRRDAETLNDIYKQAEHMPNLMKLLDLEKSAFFGGIGSALEKGLSGVGRTLSNTGKSGLHLLHTANGGRISSFADTKLGLKAGSEEHKQFMGMSPKGQMRHILKTTGDKQHVGTLIQLHKDKGSAKLALGTTGVLGAGLVASRVNSNRNNNSGAYYG